MIAVNYTPTPTNDPNMDKNLQEIQNTLNAILVAIKELQTKAGIE